jgi:hypothetical protein
MSGITIFGKVWMVDGLTLENTRLEVAKDVIAKAKQTNTPIIVFAGDRIQQLTADEYGSLIGKKENAPNNGEDHS